MRDRGIWIIFLVIFVNLLGFGIVLPLLPYYYVESFGAGAIAIGLITAVYSLFQIISAPILGELSDKFGGDRFFYLNFWNSCIIWFTGNSKLNSTSISLLHN